MNDILFFKLLIHVYFHLTIISGLKFIIIYLYSNIITIAIEDTKDKKLELDKYSTFFITIEFIMR